MIHAPLDHRPVDAAFDVFVARQPTFRRNLQVHGYELLYRANLMNAFDGTMADVATVRVIANAFLTIGAERLLNGKPAFINFDATPITLAYAALVPASNSVVEIHHDTPLSPDVRAACEQLRQQGYTLALDDSTSNARIAAWLAFVDIVKIDFRRTNPSVRATILATCRQHKIQVLAQKLETAEDFHEAKAQGYDYYQGYFFERPTIPHRPLGPAGDVMIRKYAAAVPAPSCLRPQQPRRSGLPS